MLLLNDPCHETDRLLRSSKESHFLSILSPNKSEEEKAPPFPCRRNKSGRECHIIISALVRYSASKLTSGSCYTTLFFLSRLDRSSAISDELITLLPGRAEDEKQMYIFSSSTSTSNRCLPFLLLASFSPFFYPKLVPHRT